MLDNDFACRKLAEAVKGSLELHSQDETYVRYERLFVSMATQQKVHHIRRKAVVAGGFAAGLAAAAALLISVLLSAPSEELPFVVGSSEVSGKPGVWIESDTGETTEIRFAQGTRMHLESEAAARVVEANRDAVTLELSRGTVDAEVMGNKHTRWCVNAGPFTVTVLGTVFSVNWNADDSQIRVIVTRGIVLVQGGGLSEHGVRLLAGQHLAANGRTGEIAMNSQRTAGAKESSDGQASVASSGEMVQTEKSFAASSKAENDSGGVMKSTVSKNRSQQTDSWLVHYKNKRFAEAVSAAERSGLDRIYQTADADSLWKLADAARNAGRLSVSNDALIALRNRFNGTKKAKLAAFIIGRSAMDASHSLGIAAQWFHTYLTESPTGSMTEEVYGRLMTIYLQTNRLSSAKRVASQYASRYPQGLYINKAQQVLQK